MYKVCISLILLLCTFSLSAQGEKANSNTTTNLTSHQIKRLAKIQFYRWFLIFESQANESTIAQHMSLLDEDIELITFAGTNHGLKGMSNFINHVKNWRNAHLIENMNVVIKDSTSIHLDAEIRYQNKKPDGTQSAFRITYKTQLKQQANDLPVFKKIKLTHQPLAELPNITLAYERNMSYAFVLYWQHLTETKQFEQLNKLITPSFKLSKYPESDLKPLPASEIQFHSVAVSELSQLKSMSFERNDRSLKVNAVFLSEALEPEERQYQFTLQQKPNHLFAKATALRLTTDL